MRSIFLLHFAVLAAATLHAAPDSQQTPPTPVSAINRSLPSWVRLTGELRARGETVLGNRFTEGEDDSYLLQRVRLGVELKPLPYLQMFVQGQDSRVSFTDRINPAPFRDSADLRQAWFQFGHGEKSSFNFRIGRQELAFGEERLVGASNWGNVGRSFDAAKLAVQHDGYGATFFASSVVVPRDHAFDRHLDGDNLHGAYGSITRLIPQAAIEPYVFWRVAPRVQAEAGAFGRLDSKTTGFRWAGKLPYATEYTAEMVMQRGSWGNDSVSAWAGFWRLGRTFGRSDWRPTLRLELNHASGDKDPNDRLHGTFDVLYPTPHDKYGLADQVGWKNVNHIGLIGEVKPKQQLVLQAKVHDWWLDAARDGLYNSGGALLVRDRTGTSGTHVGEEVDLQVSWAAMPGLQVAGGVGHMFAGEFLRHATPGNSYTFAYTTLVYGF